MQIDNPVIVAAVGCGAGPAELYYAPTRPGSQKRPKFARLTPRPARLELLSGSKSWLLF